MAHHWVWNASPILASFGAISLHWYGLLFALGFIFGAQIAAQMFKREGIEVKTLDQLVGYMVVGTIIGARLGHTLIYEPEIYLQDPIRILKIWEGGLASHGGTVGVILSVWFWSKKYWKRSFLELLDLLSVPVALVAAMIRIGNFFNSEIIGRPTDVPWAIVFQRVDLFPRHPTMLYESLAYLCTFAILGWLFLRKMHRGRPGFLFGVFFILLFSARFLIEFVKEPQVSAEAEWFLDFGQLLSIPFIILGVVLVVRAWKMSGKVPKTRRN